MCHPPTIQAGPQDENKIGQQFWDRLWVHDTSVSCKALHPCSNVDDGPARLRRSNPALGGWSLPPAGDQNFGSNSSTEQSSQPALLERGEVPLLRRPLLSPSRRRSRGADCTLVQLRLLMLGLLRSP